MTREDLTDCWLWESPLLDNLDAAGIMWAGARVLDLGCGRGRIARHLADRGASVTGLDVGPSSEWNREQAGPPVRFAIGAGERLPFVPGCFDAVVSCSTLQYQEHGPVLGELARVTRAGGLLLLHENLPHNPWILVYRFLRRLRGRRDPALNAYVSSIRGYLSPGRLKARAPGGALRLDASKRFYFLAPFLLRVRAERRASWPVRTALAADALLMRLLPPLRALGWFCTYRVRVQQVPTRYAL